jgi:hypothetical protein
MTAAISSPPQSVKVLANATLDDFTLSALKLVRQRNSAARSRGEKSLAANAASFVPPSSNNLFPF